MSTEDPTKERASEAIFDNDGSRWEARTREFMNRAAHIIALRGAGSVNGIARDTADSILVAELIPRLQKLLHDGEVVVMYDGDTDNPQKPDIGYIMGRLRSTFGQTFEGRITFIAVQKKSWYTPKSEGASLTNESGQEYETYVFPDGTFEKDHAAFTQSTQLANYKKYEQWFVGAAGPIAAEQLFDLNNKVLTDKRKVTIFFAPINEGLSEELDEALRRAEESGDTEEAERLKKLIHQRSNKFGALFNNQGQLRPEVSGLKKLDIKIV